MDNSKSLPIPKGKFGFPTFIYSNSFNMKKKMSLFHAFKSHRTFLIDIKIGDDIIVGAEYQCQVGDACYYKSSSKM